MEGRGSRMGLQTPVEPQEIQAAHGRAYECRNCGNELYVNALCGEYCHWCGKKLAWRGEGGDRE